MIGSPIPITRSMMTLRFLSACEGTVVNDDASMYRRRLIQRIIAGMAIELPTMSLVANTRWAPVKSSSIKPKKKLTYITPDWSPIDSIVVPNN